MPNNLADLPSEPGIYFHKNKRGQIIYIGKASNLKHRVKSYFQKTSSDPKTAALQADIATTEWRVTPSEIDALFLESEMVKRYKPKYNILLQDDKSSSFIRIDMKSDVPTVTLTRNPIDDRSEYFGPYYGTTVIRKALKILRRIWPFYDRPYNGKKTLYTDLFLTPGLEVNRATPADYKRDLRRLIKFIEGDGEKLTKQISADMGKAARDHDFEQAAKLRNQLAHLRELQTKIVFGDQHNIDLQSDLALRELQKLLRLPEPPRRIEGFDISHQSGQYVVASNVVFRNGVASRADYKKFKIREDKNDDFAAMREVITRRLKHLGDWGRPDLILIDGGLGQLSAVHDLLEAAKIPYVGLAKKEETIILPTSEAYLPHPTTSIAHSSIKVKNLRLGRNSHLLKLLQRIRDESHRFAVNYHTVLKRKGMFK
ncbi:GIY-YIG nuclease family protein [Candidatus Saccharibacteria bacterium]|nr:GIY-YIG nuclease family protein [Candidatus Saccharibacteria bacterium]